MTSRTRSPSYPSTPLGEAIDFVAKIHRSERSNVIDREVAAKAMGYSGLSGRSATVLGNLNQYGLLERAGKNEVRVTKRAVEILYPDSTASKAAALREAADEPDLFQKINERFVDGKPSSAALKSFFVKEGFTDTAIPAAVDAYLETYQFIENTIESERTGAGDPADAESVSNQQVDTGGKMQGQTKTPEGDRKLPFVPTGANSGKATFQWDGDRIVLSGGVVATQEEADQVIAFLKALRPMLKAKPPVSETHQADDVTETTH